MPDDVQLKNILLEKLKAAGVDPSTPIGEVLDKAIQARPAVSSEIDPTKLIVFVHPGGIFWA
jgi:hypothetical protein